MGAPNSASRDCLRIISKINPASTLRRHSVGPPAAAIVHVKHHPLQWNIGSVHR